MGFIKEKIHLIAAWWAAEEQQSRALSKILCFFAVMLVLTLIARGAAGAVLPVVGLETARRGTITQGAKLQGVVEAMGSLPIACPEGLTVQSILVQAGQTVEEGQPLAAFDKSGVDLALKEGKAQLQKLNAQLTALQAQTPVEAGPLETAQYAEQWAQEEYDRLMGDGDASDDQRRAAEQSLTNARLTLEAAKRAYSQAVEAAQQTAKANEADAALVRVQISRQKEQNAALQKLLENGCQLLAPQGGTVSRLELALGSPSGKTAGLLAGTESGCSLELILTEEQAEQLANGAKATVTQGRAKTELALPSPIYKEDGSAALTLALPAEAGFKPGAAKAELTFSRSDHESCVSPGAVHYENGAAYVLLVRKSQTVLGLQNVVMRMPVTVEATGPDLVAVTGGIMAGDEIIASSDRAIGEGDRVRVKGT